MMRILTLQTLFFSLLPFSLWGFNLSLSFEDRLISHSSTSSFLSIPSYTQSDSTDLNEEERKFIKDSLNAKGVYEIKTVVIDAGHGGHDPGCSGPNSREKHLALGIAKKLAVAMRSQYPGLKVILTRDRDVFIPLHKRAAIANQNKADLFISIHCNFMPGSKATSGTETYVMGLHTAKHNLDVAKRENASILLEDDYKKFYDYDPNSPEGHIILSMYQNAFLEQSILFANKVEKAFKNLNRRSRGVKQAGFVVLKETTMPSVLIEAGFLSNAKEESFLRSANGQQFMANAILYAFEQYKEEIETGVEQPMVSNEPIANTQPVYKNDPFVSKGGNTTTHKVRPIRESATHTPKPSYEQGNNRYSSSTSRRTPSYPGTLMATEEIQFHVQLAASPKPLDTSLPRWQTIGYMIEVVVENEMYKYQARNFASLQQAYDARVWLKSRGFPDAFIVAYRNGEKITLEQAKRALTIRP